MIHTSAGILRQLGTLLYASVDKLAALAIDCYIFAGALFLVGAKHRDCRAILVERMSSRSGPTASHSRQRILYPLSLDATANITAGRSQLGGKSLTPLLRFTLNLPFFRTCAGRWGINFVRLLYDYSVVADLLGDEPENLWRSILGA